jgi:sigma-B regulation protein RsbU (phosphoserine phosphatase)
MSPEGGLPPDLPAQVRETLDEFGSRLDLNLHVWSLGEDGSRTAQVYPALENGAPDGMREPSPDSILRCLSPKDGPALQLEICSRDGLAVEDVASLLQSEVERALDFAQEVRFFTHELSGRYEEINLLYSISETLGSILILEEATHDILREVCDVLGAEGGSLWVYDRDRDLLRLTASVGPGSTDPLDSHQPDVVTSRVFEEGRSRLGARGDVDSPHSEGPATDISVPISYSRRSGEARIVGVIDLFGRVRGEPFTTSDQKLLSAIASQVGAALENNRLIQESLKQERMSHEMELAHNLQKKLLTSPEAFDRADVAARVASAELVGGDFFHLFKLPSGKIGVMIGDVSSHGFPAALIMALCLSAASIYALESPHPAEVLRRLDDALSGELETTEMFVSLCYVVIDPTAEELRYSNAGHPHAWIFRSDGEAERLVATDPPMGFAGADSYTEERVSWRNGDTLVLFTDGLSDTLATPEPGSGEAAIVDAVKRELAMDPTHIVDALFELADDATPYVPADDRTALVLRT